MVKNWEELFFWVNEPFPPPKFGPEYQLTMCAIHTMWYSLIRSPAEPGGAWLTDACSAAARQHCRQARVTGLHHDSSNYGIL